MMCIVHNCPGGEPILFVSISVYVPLLFFSFGAKWRLSDKRSDAGSGYEGLTFEDALKKFGRGVLLDLRNLVLPLIGVGLIPVILDIARTPYVHLRRAKRIGEFFESVLWSLNGYSDEHGSVGVLWFLTALFIVLFFARLLSFISYRGSYSFRTALSVLFSVYCGCQAMILAGEEIVPVLALDAAMAGMFFFGMGVLYIDGWPVIHRFRYVFAAVFIPFWVYGISQRETVDFGAKGYTGPFVYLVAIGGIVLFLYLATFLEENFPRAASVLGLAGRFPIAFICLHYIDGLFYFWWELDTWGVNVCFRFAVLALLSRVVGRVIRSFGPARKGPHRGFLMSRRSGNIAFCIFFALAYARLFFNGTMFYLLVDDWRWINRPYDAAVLGLVVLAGANIIKCRDKRLKLLWISMIIVGLLQFHRGGPLELFTLFLLIVAMADRRMEPVYVISLVIGSAMMIGAYWGSMHGYLPYFVYQTGGPYGGHAFGMVYRTDLASHVLYLVMTFALLRREKLRSVGYMAMVFATWFIWRYTQARANTFSMIMFITCFAAWLLIYLIAGRKIQLPRWTAAVHMVCCEVILTMVFFYKGSLGSVGMIDAGSFWARLSLSLQGFKDYPLRLLGTYVEERGAGGLADTNMSYYFLDITYVRNIIMYGIIFAILYLGLMTWTSIRAAQEKRPILGLALIVIAVVSMIEHHASDLSFNVIILAAFADLSRKKPQTEDIAGTVNRIGRNLRGLIKR